MHLAYPYVGGYRGEFVVGDLRLGVGEAGEERRLAYCGCATEVGA